MTVVVADAMADGVGVAVRDGVGLGTAADPHEDSTMTNSSSARFTGYFRVAWRRQIWK